MTEPKFEEFIQARFREWQIAKGRTDPMPSIAGIPSEVQEQFMLAVAHRDIGLNSDGTFTFDVSKSNQAAKKPYSFFSETNPIELNRRYILLTALLTELLWDSLWPRPYLRLYEADFALVAYDSRERAILVAEARETQADIERLCYRIQNPDLAPKSDRRSRKLAEALRRHRPNYLLAAAPGYRRIFTVRINSNNANLERNELLLPRWEDVV